MKKKNYFSGTSGLKLPVPKRLFPAEHSEKSGLEYYGVLFNSLEVNSSFYKLPRVSTVEKWAASVPDDFRFTFKISKAITHDRHFAFEQEAIKLFMQTINHAAGKKGCVLVQFPPNVTVAKTRQVESLLKSIKKYDRKKEWHIAVEFRNISWYSADTYAMMNKYGACIVMQDLPPAITPPHDTTSGLVYLRFHGTEKGYRGSYTDDFLKAQAKQIKSWLKEGKIVYAYFNNTLGGAAQNLATLNGFVEK